MPHDIIVTKKEALGILGLNKSRMESLEHAAKLLPVRGRVGYSAMELKRLLDCLRRMLRR